MRIDGRQNEELREITFTRNFTKYAKGSVLAEFGDTKVLVCATCDNSKPKWMPADETSGWITAEYSLLPSSTSVRCQRERTKLSGRTQEIQRLIGRSLRACVDLHKLGERTITIDADVIQADGGTRCASICGGYVALNDLFNRMVEDGEIEENPIIEPIAAISVGILNGAIMVDLCYEEDSSAEVDSNLILTGSGKIIEIQGTAEGDPFSKEEFDTMFYLAKKSVSKIISMY